MPHCEAWLVRMRHAVGLSSTTNKRKSASLGWRVSNGDFAASVDAGNGTVKWNVEPFLGMLSTHILPPINSTRRLLMARPRPVPPYCREVDASAWLKDLNRRAMRL